MVLGSIWSVHPVDVQVAYRKALRTTTTHYHSTVQALEHPCDTHINPLLLQSQLAMASTVTTTATTRLIMPTRLRKGDMP